MNRVRNLSMDGSDNQSQNSSSHHLDIAESTQNDTSSRVLNDSSDINVLDANQPTRKQVVKPQDSPIYDSLSRVKVSESVIEPSEAPAVERVMIHAEGSPHSRHTGYNYKSGRRYSDDLDDSVPASRQTNLQKSGRTYSDKLDGSLPVSRHTSLHKSGRTYSDELDGSVPVSRHTSLHKSGRTYSDELDGSVPNSSHSPQRSGYPRDVPSFPQRNGRRDESKYRRAISSEETSRSGKEITHPQSRNSASEMRSDRNEKNMPSPSHQPPLQTKAFSLPRGQMPSDARHHHHHLHESEDSSSPHGGSTPVHTQSDPVAPIYPLHVQGMERGRYYDAGLSSRAPQKQFSVPGRSAMDTSDSRNSEVSSLVNKLKC